MGTVRNSQSYVAKRAMTVTWCGLATNQRQPMTLAGATTAAAAATTTAVKH